MSDLHELLGSFLAGPDPVVAPASDVRARGEQRRRRAQALVAGAAALVVVAGAGTAVALAGDGKPDALQVANPTPTPSGSWAPAPARLSAMVLQPEDGTRVQGGVWERSPYPRDDSFAGLQACPEADVHGSRGWVQGLSSRDSAPHDGVTSQVLEYPSAEAAARAHAAVSADVARCPRRAADSEDGKASVSSTVFALANGATGVRQVSRDCDTCQEHAADWAVVTAGQWVGYVTLSPDRRPYLQAWADALKTRLEHPVLGPQAPTATPSPSYEPVDLGPLTQQDHVEANRIGSVVVGMTLAQAEEAAGQDLKQEGDDLGGCVYYAPRSGEPDVSFMIIDGIVSRIDVDSGTTTTNTSIGIGSTEAEVKETYRNAVVSKHPYTDGHYLRALDDDGQHALLFETDGQKVTSFRGGFISAVDQIEGCA